MSRRALLTFLLTALVLTGCAKGTKVDRIRHEARAVGAPYSKVLIVGVTPNEGLRWRWERLMASTLSDEGIIAWASVREMGYDTPLNRDSVAAAVRKTGAEAVLISRLIHQKVKPEEVEERTDTKVLRSDEFASDGGFIIDFFSYNYQEVQEPSYTLLTSTVKIATDLYDAEIGKLVYSLRTTTYKKQTEWEVLDEVTIAIAKRLRRDRMTRRPGRGRKLPKP
jgi:hypothetical protein